MSHIEAMASSYHQWCQSSNSVGNVIVACLWFQLHFTSVLEMTLRFHSTRQRCEAILCSVLVFTFSTDKKKVKQSMLANILIPVYCHCGFMPTPVLSILPFCLFYFHFVYSTFLLLFAVVSHTLLNSLMCYEIYHVPINPRKAKPLILGICTSDILCQWMFLEGIPQKHQQRHAKPW